MAARPPVCAAQRILASVCACMVLLASPPALATDLELGAQSVVTLASDRQTRGGGPGAALELGTPVLGGLFQPGSVLVARGRASALVGAGLAWGAELGTAWRPRALRRWQPEVGLYALLLGGDLIRAIDAEGRRANDPLAVELGLAPLRFRLDEGWVSLLAVRAGPTLFREGTPPFVFSVTVVEVGRAFELW